MSLPYDAVLLIAFGGPTWPEEIRPFLARVTKGIPIPPERLEEVAHHYEAVGGKSPLNEITFRQANALQELLKNSGSPLPRLCRHAQRQSVLHRDIQTDGR